MEGIFTAQMLHMFMHESEKQRMPMACYFEPVNEGAMQVHPDHTELTATGQAFALLSRHAGGKLCTVDGVEDFGKQGTSGRKSVAWYPVYGKSPDDSCQG